MSAVGDWVQGFFKLLLRFFTPIGSPRGDFRHDIKAAITVKSNAFAIDCMTINISTSGILVDRALEDAKPGMRVQVTPVGGSSGISGRVIRVGANSTAIRIDGRRGSAFIGALRVSANRPAPAFGGAAPRSMAKRPSASHTTLLP
jgi:hypothetical protein